MFEIEVDFKKWTPSAEPSCYTLKFITQEIDFEKLKEIADHQGLHGKIVFTEI